MRPSMRRCIPWTRYKKEATAEMRLENTEYNSNRVGMRWLNFFFIQQECGGSPIISIPGLFVEMIL